ncbi:MAG: phospholipase D family protein [Gammaproteobacteria bacterium]|nr:phospholipase D family protein [Gammaproteobacteria bacterium]MDH5653178.1 phospholipase D family protein [Gammaproteobacteria bacterium]
MKNIILTVDDKKQSKQLIDWYQKAVDEAVELYIMTAYLTDWPVNKPLNKKCRRIQIIVGTDFGLTRRKALKKVLKWLPNHEKSALLAVESTQNFHPKLLMWKTASGKCYLVVGSSNISVGGFEKNIEANIQVDINKTEFEQVRNKVWYLRDNHSTPVSEDWINSYNESEISNNNRGKKKKKKAVKKNNKTSQMDFSLLTQGYIANYLKYRREQQKGFNRIKSKLTALVKQCASGNITSAEFYKKMYKLWSADTFRFQGEGFQIWGKHARWNQTCSSLLNIINARGKSTFEMDELVKNEIDFLQSKDNRTRKSWLSEMICHYYPEIYPVRNKPVRKWLSDSNYKAPRKASDGAIYIDIALKLRSGLNQLKPRVQNLAQMDTLIWRWHDLKYPKKKPKR